MTFEQWFESGDPIVDRIGNSPDIMWQLQQAYKAGQHSSFSEIDHLSKDNHDRAEEIIDAREEHIRALQIEQQELFSDNFRLTKELNEAEDAMSDLITEYAQVVAERDRLRELS